MCLCTDVNQLRDTVEWWLQHPQELTAKASAGQQWALHNVLTDHFFEQVTELYVAMLCNVTHGSPSSSYHHARKPIGN